MRAHIVLNRRNKEGSVFVPEVDLQLKACSGGKRGWVEVYFTDGMHYEAREVFAFMGGGEPPKPKMTKVEWLKQNFDFVAEVDVPLLMIRFALEAEEKKRRQIEAFGGLFDDMIRGNPKPLDLRKEKDFAVMAKGAERLKNIMDSKEPGEISDAKKYAMALQIQRWIHEAGGLC